MRPGRMLVVACIGLLAMLSAGNPASAAADRFSVAETANALITLNLGQAELARAVLDQLQDQQVREFAQQTLERHSRLNRELLTFTDRHGIEPAQTPISSDLKNRMVAHEHSLQKLSPAAMADAYLLLQVDLYQYALSLMDDRLLPSAESPRLRELLKETRALLARQLSRANWLQAQMPEPDAD